MRRGESDTSDGEVPPRPPPKVTRMLHVHRAERADGLVAALTALLAVPLGDPFAPEVVAVPTRGMERWLTQRMSAGLGATPGRADGVCANVEFPSPRRLVAEAVAIAADIDPDADAWPPERMVWPLLEVVDASLGEPWLQNLAAHIGGTLETADPSRQARRFASVKHVADLFDRYALHRPGMVRAWAAGRDVGATGAPLPGDAAWQAELWRRLRERIGQPDPAERIEGATARLRERPELLELPGRLSLFGLTRLPAGRLQVLRGDRRPPRRPPVPAAPLAGAVASGWRRSRWRPRGARRTPRASCPPTACSRRGARTCASCSSWSAARRAPTTTTPPPSATTRCSAASRRTCAPTAPRPARRCPIGTTSACCSTDDRSVQVHACHGRARQVEVLRDAILHLLADDPALEPRDVIVMCPDIETFAPLIQATFGAGEISPADDELEDLPEELRPPDLRVRLADRSLRQTNAVLGFVVAPARARRAAAHRLAGARPRRPRAGPPAVPARRRRPRPDRGVGGDERDPLGPGRRAPRAVQARAAARGHVARRPGPDAARRRDDRRRAAAVRRRAPARRRRQRRHRPRRPARRADRPARDGARRDARTDAGRRVGGRDRGRRRRADRDLGQRGVAARGAPAAARRRRPRGRRRRRARDHHAVTSRGTGAARRPAPGPPDPRELPHRPPDDLHARADAVRAAPRRLPARARRRRVPAQGRHATATTSCSATRTSATATRAPRTARCCSTR